MPAVKGTERAAGAVLLRHCLDKNCAGGAGRVRVRVFTLQGYDLCTFAGPIKLECGTYRSSAKVTEAQRTLYGLINEDQVVWCGQEEPTLVGASGRYLHEIVVDDGDIVAVIDTLAWYRIIGYEPRYIFPEVHQDLRQRAVASGGDYEEELRRLEDKWLEKYSPQELSEEELWKRVRRRTIENWWDELLLKFPFQFSTIAKVDVVTKEMARSGRRGKGRRAAWW